jgi:hypothetical protein
MEQEIIGPNEIAQVRSWIGQRGFSYTDVQAEILDHVLCGMEAKMQADPQMSLRNAFDQVHQSFGVFGFATIEEAMTIKVERQIWKDYWMSLRYFTTQKGVLFLLACLMASYLISLFSRSLTLLMLPYWLLFLGNVLYKIRNYRAKRALKSFLTFRLRFAYGILTFPFGYYLAANPWLNRQTAEEIWLWPAMLICGLVCLLELCSLRAFKLGIEQAVKQAERHLQLS